MVFADRADAGRRLAARLQHLADEPVVVLGLPRGGVPVAFEVARALGAPLDVIVVRKLGVPFQPELGMGAIGEDGVRVINHEVVRAAGVSVQELAAVEARERAEVQRRAWRYRGGRPRPPPGWQDRIGGDADELVSVQTPRGFLAIGQFYADFCQVADDEVVACLRRAATPVPAAGASAAPADDPPAREVADDPPGRDEEVKVRAGAVQLAGRLTVPGAAAGI